MQISVLKKLLQLIKNEIPEDERSSEETSDQSPEENDKEEFGIEEDDEGMQNAECKMQNAECRVQSCESEGVQSDEDEKPAPDENNRSHLTSSVPRAAKTPTGYLTKGELKEIRELFKNLDDKEIQRLYKKVTK